MSVYGVGRDCEMKYRFYYASDLLFKKKDKSPYINGMRLPNENGHCLRPCNFISQEAITKLTNNVFQNILYRRYQIQKEIAINKDSTQKFTEQWELYTNILK